MLTVEIRVNTALVGFLYLHNEGETYVDGKGALYKAEYYVPDQICRTEHVIHNPDDGFAELVKIALDAVTK